MFPVTLAGVKLLSAVPTLTLLPAYAAVAAWNFVPVRMMLAGVGVFHVMVVGFALASVGRGSVIVITRVCEIFPLFWISIFLFPTPQMVFTCVSVGVNRSTLGDGALGVNEIPPATTLGAVP